MVSAYLHRRTTLAIIAATLVLLAFVLWLALRRRSPVLPASLMNQLDPQTRQVILVLSPQAHSAAARLWLLERPEADSAWQTVTGPLEVTLGRNGLAAGRGEHHGGLPAELAEKREGDGCSPAGIFRLPTAFGDAPPKGLRIEFLRCTPTLRGVDDVKSSHYNQIVDSASVPSDWDSAEEMQRADGLYKLGAVVAHNADGLPGGGSCIFLHLWRGAGQPTAGCTAMTEEHLRHVLQWLDPAAEPRLVQTLEP